MRGEGGSPGAAPCELLRANCDRSAMYEMPSESGPRVRNTAGEADEAVHSVRDSVPAESQQETHDLLQEVLVLVGREERGEAMEGAFTREELLELRETIRAATKQGNDVLPILWEQARVEEEARNPWLGGEWEGQPRVETGVPNRVDRLRGLGNAVVPQVAEWIGRRIIEAERRTVP